MPNTIKDENSHREPLKVEMGMDKSTYQNRVKRLGPVVQSSLRGQLIEYFMTL